MRRAKSAGATASCVRGFKEVVELGERCAGAWSDEKREAAEAGAGGTRSRTLTVDASGGGCSEVPARRRR